MLSKFILKSYATLIEISIWITLIGGMVNGARMANYYGSGVGGVLFGGLIGLLMAFVFCVTIFGGFLILNDIRSSVQSIENKK